ncbi:MAG: NACHT domain-containing protein [Cyanobacteria bacterium P01_A01_bin.17]
MPENPDKIADKLGVNAPNSQVNIENMFFGSSSDDSTKQQDAPIDWQQICRDMLVEREQLTSNRLMVSPDMHKTLDLFVDLALVQQKKADKRDEDVLPEYGSKLYEPSRYSKSERYEFNRFLEDVLGAQKNEKLTIVGEPGCGKTTLLQKIAFWLLDNTEDLVLWVSLGELQDKPLRDYLTEDWLQDAVMHTDERIIEDWGRQFLQRRVWLLLDGLDEMTPETRDALSLKGWVSQARVIVTCRLNVWQTNPRIINGFATYRMLEFRLSQIEDFTQKWFAQDEAAGKHLYQALNQPGKERIRDLVKNPLRLTLLCSTWHLRERQLPDTRAELYEQFVDDLYEWKRERFPTSSQQRAELNYKLGELARESIDKELTRFRLRHDLVCRVLGEAEDANSMLRLALDLGWLNTVGVNPKNPREPVYAFFHATLQEYFAAKDIEDWEFFMPSEHEDEPVKHTEKPEEIAPYRIFEPQWKEVILLWLGREDIELEKKYEFLDALLSFEDGCGNFYSDRAFFLAALGILECSDHPDSEEVIQQLVTWGFGKLDPETDRWLIYFEPLERQAKVTIVSIANTLVLTKLRGVLKIAKGPFTRYKIANTICSIDFADPEAINELRSLLNSAEHDGQKLDIANSLIQISPNIVEAEDTLVELSKFSQYEWIRCDAAWSLINAKSDHPVGVDALINLLCTSRDEAIVWSLRFDELGIVSSKIIRTLLKMSYLGPTSETRARSIDYLAELLIADEQSIDKFLRLTKIPKLILDLRKSEPQSNLNGIHCLELIMDSVDKLQASKNKKERRKNFFKLMKVAIERPEFIMLLAKIATTKGAETRKKLIVELFEEIHVDISLVIPTWISLLEKMEGRLGRIFLASGITKSGFEDDRIADVLTDLLVDTPVQDENGRRWLAEGLRRYDPTNQMAITTFLDMLQHSENWNTCRWVAGDLGEACNDDPQLVEPLFDLFSKTSERRIQESIAAGLQEVFHLDALKRTVRQTQGLLTSENRKSNFSIYKNSYEILWHCASRLPYSAFYQEWHCQSGDSNTELKSDEVLAE